MPTPTATARAQLENLVDSVAVPSEGRAVLLAIATHAYIMGASSAVVQQHAVLEAVAKTARELAAPLGIQIVGPETAPTRV